MKFRVKQKRYTGPVNVSSVIAEYFKETGLEKQFVIETLKRSWNEIVGSLLSVHSIPYKIIDGILHVAVDHPLYSNDISMRKESIMKEIQTRGYSVRLHDMKVEVKRLMWKKGQ